MKFEWFVIRLKIFFTSHELKVQIDSEKAEFDAGRKVNDILDDHQVQFYS
jgi:hypothetical protein